MGSHPNVVLMAVLKPDDLSRKTMRGILEEAETVDDYAVKIGGVEYTHIVMESDYEEGHQIAADEGDLVFFDLVTYGYGETVTWDKLEKQKSELEQWATEACKRHNCSCKIYVTANYW